MAKESFKIRITKDGRIFLGTNDLSEERLRRLRDMIEECLGPTQRVDELEDGGGAPPGASLVDKEEEEKIERRSSR